MYNPAHLDIIYNSMLRLVHKYKIHHGTAIRPCRSDPNYFAGTAGRVVRASASQGNTMMHVHGFESRSAREKICQK